jgi:hypothetical protein
MHLLKNNKEWNKFKKFEDIEDISVAAPQAFPCLAVLTEDISTKVLFLYASDVALLIEGLFCGQDNIECDRESYRNFEEFVPLLNEALKVNVVRT